MARGVQGRMALTKEPSWSEMAAAVAEGAEEVTAAARASLRGSMKRVLWYREKSLR